MTDNASRPVPVNEPRFAGNERKYLNECLDTGWISSEGPFIQRFEEQFARRVGRTYGVALSSGTAALDVAVAALGLGKGDEVILPAFTIISCAAAIVRAGATPVLVDADPDTWNMDAAGIEKKITARTKALMVVHLYGLPADMAPILDLAEKHGLQIIEDAAEMHGQTYRGRPCGSFGELSAFSFYANKHITTGEGGMLVTDDLRLAERCRSLRNLCFQPGKRFIHDELGWNYRMTNLQAALGLAQLEQLDEVVKIKRNMGALYSERLKDIKGLQLPKERTDFAENIYWVYGVVLRSDVPFDAEEAMKKLSARRIGSRPFFFPMHEQPVFLKMGLFRGEQYPVAERLARRGFYIPSGLALTDEQMHRAADAVQALLEDNGNP